MYLGQVALDGGSAKVGFEPCQIDVQGFEGAQEQRVPLKTVQPHGGVGIDVLEGARDHLQAGIVDLMIG